MKAALLLVPLAVAALGPTAPAQETPRATPPARGAEAPATPAPAPAPIVRLPAAPETAPAVSSSTDASGQVNWTQSTVGLREGAAAVARTNRVPEVRGIAPRIARPERKGVGGFFAGFANLFNPFAPVDKSESPGGPHTYDGQANIAPLPRGLRDERYHEPQSELIVLGVEGDPKKATKRKP